MSSRWGMVMGDSGEGPFTKLIALGTVALIALAYVPAAASLSWWPFAHSSSIPVPSNSPSLAISSSPSSIPSNTGQTVPCTFLYGSVIACSSSNPTVTLDGLFESNAFGCTFDFQITWGDASKPQDVAFPGGPAGPVYVANHTYATAGTHTIDFTPVTSTCRSIPGRYEFTLLRNSQ